MSVVEKTVLPANTGIVGDPTLYEAPEGKETEVIMHKLYLNGFPKSGLHKAVLMALGLTNGPAHQNAWAGTNNHNGWGSGLMEDWRIYKHLARLKEGYFLKGHSIYRLDIERFLWQIGAAVLFIYRDLRDVAVSMSYHVVSENDDDFLHPHKDIYRQMKNHDEVLAACIRGVAHYSSLIERWRTYAGWLDVDWVHPVRFEDMTHQPEKVAADVLNYVMWRTGQAHGVSVQIPGPEFEAGVEALVKNMTYKEESPTFRKGTTGQWKEEFKPEHKALFKKYDKEQWLVKLGYEKDNTW